MQTHQQYRYEQTNVDKQATVIKTSTTFCMVYKQLDKLLSADNTAKLRWTLKKLCKLSTANW